MSIIDKSVICLPAWSSSVYVVASQQTIALACSVLVMLEGQGSIDSLQLEAAVKAYDVLNETGLPAVQQQKFDEYRTAPELEKHNSNERSGGSGIVGCELTFLVC